MINSFEMIYTENDKNNVFERKDDNQLLSRRRRYLSFPEGSSLQLGMFE